MMVRIGMIGIAAILLAMPLRKEKGEFALLLVLAAGMLIFVYSLARIPIATYTGDTTRFVGGNR